MPASCVHNKFKPLINDTLLYSRTGGTSYLFFTLLYITYRLCAVYLYLYLCCFLIYSYFCFPMRREKLSRYNSVTFPTSNWSPRVHTVLQAVRHLAGSREIFSGNSLFARLQQQDQLAVAAVTAAGQ